MSKLLIEEKCCVCGMELEDYPYDPISLRPNDSVICPACGIHYGFDDEGAGEVVPASLTETHWHFGDETHKAILAFWRERWIEGGMKWWSPHPQPENWNPRELIKSPLSELE